MARIVVGLSGGVDSSVAALLLKEQGHEVIGIFMRNWNDESVTLNNECPWVDDSTDAQLIADQLGIPFQTLDFSAEYKKRIVDYMFREYEAGRTPNPDVLCNREIKFDIFLKAAQMLHADFVATGHYCQKSETQTPKGTLYHLIAGADPNKDQSYFLCQLTPQQLRYALFPIGHLQKSEVRALAKKHGLITADKKDSQGLCFVGKVRLPDFLQQQLKPKNGKVFQVAADMPQYEILKAPIPALLPHQLHRYTAPYTYAPQQAHEIGSHRGAHFYTVGQRKGLGIGGKEIPLFIVHTDTSNNSVFVGAGHDFPGLFRRGLFVPAKEVHWVRPDLALTPGQQASYRVRVRYRQPLANALLICTEEGVHLLFEKPMWGVTPGQFAAWYAGDELIGSGVISG
jgi:tRNA-specific 2-thiouridylase